MSKYGKSAQRATEIRHCRQEISSIVREAKTYDEDGKTVEGVYDPAHILVPVQFIEAIGVWLDKALIVAQYMNDDLLPEVEVDHALRVSRFWNNSGSEPTDPSVDTHSVGNHSPVPARKPKGRDSLR